MYGTWFGSVAIGLFALAALISLIVLASPIFAVVLALLALAFVASLFAVLRGQRARSAAGPRSPESRRPYGGGAAPPPRSGGAPASGEGHARGGETAG